MSRQTFALSFYCRSSKADKNGYAPVELSIIINNKRTYVKLQRKEKPDVFRRNLNSTRDNATKVYRDNQIVRINQIVDEMSFAGVELTAANLKACLRKGGVVDTYTLGELWADIISNKKNELDDGDIVTDTHQRYLLAKAALYEANGFSDQTPAKAVELQHINNLQHYLRGVRKTSQYTAFNYHARCRAAFRLAVQRGKIMASPYADYKMSKGERTEKVFLSKAELTKITKKPLEGRLDRARDLFLLQCYSGLSYSDMAALTPEDFTNREGDLIMVTKKRKKTGVTYKSMIYGEGVRILEKYNYNLPIISNVKLNAYLKEVQDICGIDKRLHTHLGRTTYICNLYNKGIDPSMIAEIVGHTSSKTTLKYYAKMDGSTIFDTFRQKALGRAKNIPSDEMQVNLRELLRKSSDSVKLTNDETI